MSFLIIAMERIQPFHEKLGGHLPVRLLTIPVQATAASTGTRFNILISLLHPKA